MSGVLDVIQGGACSKRRRRGGGRKLGGNLFGLPDRRQ